MLARVTLEIALRKEFDYVVPPELVASVQVGTRVRIPFGARQVMGVVTALPESSPHTQLRSILGVVGKQSQITPYCCAPEIAIKSVLPDAVRKEKDGWRERLFVRAMLGTKELPKLTRRQTDVWHVIEERRELPLQELLELTGATSEVVRRLEDRGLVEIAPQILERDPYAREEILPSQQLSLNAEQARALAEITAVLHSPQVALAEQAGANRNKSSVFLLHGVTGSGKTEVYLQAIDAALAQGKGAIVLVPEISLTPQTVERFKARFCHGPRQTLVAVLHSHLSAGERHDEWHKIRQGRARIVIGARSAVFAPVDPLGLIIVDEEHEHSYKQEEAPRYHARDVAVVRGEMEGAVVVLGSATPSMESFANATKGKYRLLDMPTRIDDRKLPVVRVIDMRNESRKQKGSPIFSTPLKDALSLRLERKEQAMLFLNRRGYSTSMQCQTCGYVAGCPNCSISLTYHRWENTLRCHICGHQSPAPTVCPEASCKSPGIRYSGLGTEKVEDTLKKLFPQARVARMDSDTLQKKEDYRRVLGDFRTGKIDILVGTQMIAKGLHFPNVTLVGIVYADLSLHMPDFRAGERTFQLLTQVSGRAGRGDVEGEVFVQAFTPFHPAIQYARRHDYRGFYEQEVESREALQFPPFRRMALLTVRGRNEEKVAYAAQHLRKVVETALAGWKNVVFSGPAPAPLAKAETYYRYHLLIRGRQMSRLSGVISACLAAEQWPEDIRVTADIDPVNLG
ncbi:MAG: primosomal protein N' [Verrucomicrobia bacterium]|nr:primosomal protein N' [Verrucomicrobiota bacterium]